MSTRFRLLAIFVGIFFVMSCTGVFLCAAKAKSQKPRFYIKAKGIGSIAAAADYGDFADRNEIYFNGINSTSVEHTIAVTTTPFFRGFGAEIGFETHKYAVGISAAYIEKNFHIDYDRTRTSGYQDKYIRDHRLSALPIFLLIHYKLIDTSFMSAFVTIGEGVYLTTYRDERAQTFQQDTRTYVNSFVESKKNHLGFHLGATFDFKISGNLAIFVEAAYRYVRLREIEAKDFYEDNTLEEPVESEGDLYYWTNDRTGESRFVIGEPDNTQPNWKGLPAELDLSGFSLSVGIKITFGSGKTRKPVKIAPLD